MASEAAASAARFEMRIMVLSSELSVLNAQRPALRGAGVRGNASIRLARRINWLGVEEEVGAAQNSVGRNTSTATRVPTWGAKTRGSKGGRIWTPAIQPAEPNAVLAVQVVP